MSDPAIPQPATSGQAPSRPNADRLASLMRLLDADPGDTFCLYGIAQEHASRGAHAEAVRWYDRVITGDPAHGYAYFHKARSEEALGAVSEAIITLRAGLAASAHDPKATGELAGYLAMLED